MKGALFRGSQNDQALFKIALSQREARFQVPLKRQIPLGRMFDQLLGQPEQDGFRPQGLQKILGEPSSNFSIKAGRTLLW